MKKSAIARIGRVLAVCLILALLPGALAQTQAVIKQDTYVFKKPDVTSAHLKVKKGTTVELVASKGQWALVEKNGYMAFMNKAQLSVKKNIVDESNKEPAVLLETVRVYKAPSRSSASRRVSIGTQVELIAVSGSWAMIKKGGVYAFAPAAYVATFKQLKKNGVTLVLEKPALVYKQPSPDSAHLLVPAGTEVNILAILHSVALVEHDGAFGYMPASAFF